MDHDILVIGATGQQGGSVVDALLDEGATVRALVRDPLSEKAQALAARGVDLRQGDLDHVDTVSAAGAGATGAFILTSHFTTSVEAEIAQGMAVVEAFDGSDVPFIVYSSISDADRGTGIPHFDGKWVVEQRLAELETPSAVIAPVAFMENIVFPWTLPALQNGVYPVPVTAETPVQQIAVRDIGRYTAQVLLRPDEFAGRRLNIAGDQATGPETAAALSEASGRVITFAAGDRADVLDPDLRRMYEWFEQDGYTADLLGLKAEFPTVNALSISDWAALQDWETLLNTPVEMPGW